MCKNCDYTIHGAQHHFGWDNSIAPVQHAEPGSTILFHCHDSSAGQLGPNSTVDDVAALDFSKINPVSGPIYVAGAQPGDVLKVTIDSFVPQARDGAGFGWTANIPGFGLLADQFTDPALHIWKFDPATMAPAMFGKEGQVPLKPFAGTIGNAMGEPGLHSVVPRAGSAAIWISVICQRAPRYTCRSKSLVRFSAWATPMPPKAMARYAAPQSKARWMLS